MQLPPILQGESITRLLQGAFVGFAAPGEADDRCCKDMADKSAATAVVTALAPIFRPEGWLGDAARRRDG